MKVFKWVVSVLLFIWGIFSLFTAAKSLLFIVVGIMTMALAGLICPLVKNFKSKKILIVLLIIGIFVLYYFIGGQIQ